MNPRRSRLCGGAAALATLLLAVAAQASPLLSEVFYDASGSDNGLSFVELWGDPGASLDGLYLENINGSDGAVIVSLALSGMFPSDGLFVVADDDGGGSTLVAGADLILNFDFQNGPDSVVLRSAEQVLDALGYGEFAAGDVFAGEGQPAPDAAPGSSLARVFANVDTDDNARDFRVLESPTAGSAPIAAVPEPSGAGLLALGLAGLGRARRRLRSAPRSPGA